VAGARPGPAAWREATSANRCSAGAVFGEKLFCCWKPRGKVFGRLKRVPLHPLPLLLPRPSELWSSGRDVNGAS